jgi:hypothetical protein
MPVHSIARLRLNYRIKSHNSLVTPNFDQQTILGGVTVRRCLLPRQRTSARSFEKGSQRAPALCRVIQSVINLLFVCLGRSAGRLSADLVYGQKGYYRDAAGKEMARCKVTIRYQHRGINTVSRLRPLCVARVIKDGSRQPKKFKSETKSRRTHSSSTDWPRRNGLSTARFRADFSAVRLTFVNHIRTCFKAIVLAG